MLPQSAPCEQDLCHILSYTPLQGGRQGAGAFARKHMLSSATLEMLADMRGQFATMLADIGFVRAPPRGVRASAARDRPGSHADNKNRGAWVDDRKASWNQHTGKAAVVCAAFLLAGCLQVVFTLRMVHQDHRFVVEYRRAQLLFDRPSAVACCSSSMRFTLSLHKPTPLSLFAALSPLQQCMSHSQTCRSFSFAGGHFRNTLTALAVACLIWLQVKAVLCAALYPNAAVMDEAAGKGARPAWNDGVGEVFVHPSSIAHPLETQQFARPYLVYLEKARATCFWSHDCPLPMGHTTYCCNTIMSPMVIPGPRYWPEDPDAWAGGWLSCLLDTPKMRQTCFARM